MDDMDAIEEWVAEFLARSPKLATSVDCQNGHRLVKLLTRLGRDDLWPPVQIHLGNVLLELLEGDRAANVDEAIDLYRDVLERAKSDVSVVDASVGLANATAVQPEPDPHLYHRSITSLRRLIERPSPALTPEAKAKVLSALAILYESRPFGDRGRTLRRALSLRQDAVDVLTAAGDIGSAHLGTCLYGLARCHLLQQSGTYTQHVDDAVHLLRQVCAISIDQDDLVVLAKALRSLECIYPEWTGTDTVAGALALARVAAEAADRIEEALSGPAYDPAPWTVFTSSVSALGHDLDELAAKPPPVVDQWLSDAIDYHRQAVSALPLETMPYQWASWAGGLARLLAHRSRILGDDRGLPESFRLFDQALAVVDPIRNPRLRRDLLVALGAAADAHEDWERSEVAHAEALAISDSLTALTALPEDRINELDAARTCAVLAAYAAARAGHSSEAVRLAEQGRGRSYTDALVAWERITADTDPEMRRRLTDARHRVLELEERLRTEGTDPLDELRGHLNDFIGPGAEHLGWRQLVPEREEQTQASEARARLAPMLDDARRRFRAVAQEAWDGDLAPVAPAPSADDVAAITTAAGYPLIYLVPTRHGTMALIVDPDGPVQTLEFPDLDSSLAALLLHGDDQGPPSLLRGAYYRDVDALDASLEHVVPFLNRHLLHRLDELVEQLGYRQAAIVAMGSLALLPLHARESGDGVIFRMVPSARVLRIAQERRAAPDLTDKDVYILATPEVEGHDRIAWASIEALMVEAQVKARGATVSLAFGDEPTRVLGQLEAVSVAHLACHADFRPSDPLASDVRVDRDSFVTLGDIAGGRRDLSGLDLVVILACETAAIDTDRPDDALGFPSQLLVAGAAGVVSSAWSVYDDTAAFFAHRFYQVLADGHDPAMATQRARAWLRTATGDDLLGVVIELMELVPAEDAEAHAVLTERRRSLLTQREARPYEHPIDWAAFAYSGV